MRFTGRRDAQDRGLWEDDGLVFCTHGGKPLDFRNLATTSSKPLLEKVGLPDNRFHDLCGTRAPRCCSPAATTPNSCSVSWEMPPQP